jgi:acyl carrier protein
MTLVADRNEMLLSEIEQRLTKTFHSVFGDEALVLNPSMTAADVEGWDSLTHVRLLLTVDREFRIRITASEAGKLQTVGDLMKLIESKVA